MISISSSLRFKIAGNSSLTIDVGHGGFCALVVIVKVGILKVLVVHPGPLFTSMLYVAEAFIEFELQPPTKAVRFVVV